MRTDREFSYAVQLPEFPVPSIVTRHNASDDPDQATAETVALMQAAAIEDSTSRPVWAATQGALQSAIAGDRGACEAIYGWIASHVRFRSDEPVLTKLLGFDDELDLLIRPARLLTMRRPAEDCDGFTMLCCSMLLAAGVPCEIVTIKADQDEPDRFSHVYCQAYPEDGGFIVMDCSQGAQHGYPCGWEAPEYFHRETWGVMYPEPVKQKGLHGLGDAYDDLLANAASNAPPGGYDSVNTLPPYPYPGYGSAKPASGLNWNSIINSSFGFASQLALKPGQYVQTAQGVMANQVPGAVPGGFNLGSSTSFGGLGTGTIMLGVGALALVLVLGRK